MTVLFAITSPLQVLNARFYVEQHRIDPAACHVVLFTARNESANLQTLELLARFGFSAVTRIEGAPPDRPPAAPGVDDELDRLEAAWRFRADLTEALERALSGLEGEIARFVMGDYRPLAYRQAARFIRADGAAVLLDDGSITPEVMRYRHNPRASDVLADEIARFRAYRFDRIGKADPFVAWDPRALTFFSIYSGDVGAEDRIVRNGGFRRIDLSEAERLDEAWIIGCNHVEAGLATVRSYLTAMSQLSDQFSGSPIVYKPHRGEDEAKVEMLARLFGFEIRANDRPVELAIIDDKAVPANIVSIGSSAIDNLAEMKLGKKCRLRVAAPDESYFRDGRRAEHLKRIIKRNIDRVGAHNTISVGATARPAPPRIAAKTARLALTDPDQDPRAEDVVWAFELDLEDARARSKRFKVRDADERAPASRVLATENSQTRDRFVALKSLRADQINGTIYLKFLVRPSVNFGADLILARSEEAADREAVRIEFGVTESFVHLGRTVHCIGRVDVVDDTWFKVSLVARALGEADLMFLLAPTTQRDDRPLDDAYATRYRLAQAEVAGRLKADRYAQAAMSAEDRLVLNYDLRGELTSEFLVEIGGKPLVLRFLSCAGAFAGAVQQKKLRASDVAKAVAGWRSVREGEFRNGGCSYAGAPVSEVVIALADGGDGAAYLRGSTAVAISMENGRVSVAHGARRWTVATLDGPGSLAVRARTRSADGSGELIAATVVPRTGPGAREGAALQFPVPHGVR